MFSDVKFLNRNLFFYIHSEEAIFKLSGKLEKILDFRGVLENCIAVNLRQNQLLLNNHDQRIKIVQIDDEGNPSHSLDIEVNSDGENFISGHCYAGINKLAVLNSEGNLILYKYDVEEKKYEILDWLKMKNLYFNNIKICSKLKYFFIVTKNELIIVEKYVKNSEEKLKYLQKNHFKWSPTSEFLGYRGRNLVFVKINSPSYFGFREYVSHTLQVYVFDTEKKDFYKILEENFSTEGNGRIYTLEKYGNKMLGMTNLGKCYEIKFDYQ